MNLVIDRATQIDVPAIAGIRASAALRLTEDHGKGRWSSMPTEASVRRGLAHARVLVARDGATIVGTLRLATKKPWAIDVTYFASVRRAIYLTDMAIEPAHQGRGIGRRILADAATIAREWPAEAIRLDAFDAPAGAGGFYAACGFREVGRVVYRGVPLIYYEQLL